MLTPVPQAVMHQGLWITRFDYQSEAEVRLALRRAAEAGFDTVFFQIRGNGTLMVPSRIEPWAREFGHRDPGFDALAVAIDEGHRRGVRVHAWLNMLPGWRGEQAPPARLAQLYTEHQDWFLVDQFGEGEPLDGGYLSLNPCLPQPREHLVRLCEDIVRRYDVAGLHLDYLRFPEPRFVRKGDMLVQRDYPRDKASLELYAAATGRHPDEDVERWAEWKRQQLSELVRRIRVRMNETREGLLLTAAVFAPPQRARDQVLQDWPRWLRAAWLDAVIPMVFTSDDAEFSAALNSCLNAAQPRSVFMGIGVYQQPDPEQSLRQMRLASEGGAKGFVLYGYASFFGSARPSSPAERPSLRQQRRERILPELRSQRRR